jgi:hypothetical protein
MALETGTFISDLVPTNPVGSDPLAFADDHLRLLKGTIKNTFPNITGAVTKTHTQINAMGTVAEVLAAVYPVGSIYTNATNATNPASLLGFGTWVSFGAGRVPVGFDGGDALFNAAEKTGGSKDATLVSHSHSGSTGGQSNDHSHFFSAGTSSAGDHNHLEYNYSTNGSGDGPGPGASCCGGAIVQSGVYTGNAGTHSHSVSGNTNGVNSDHSHSFTTSSAGSSATNANVQPYITVYMWKRTA